jgi:hypothetical protein
MLQRRDETWGSSKKEKIGGFNKFKHTPQDHHHCHGSQVTRKEVHSFELVVLAKEPKHFLFLSFISLSMLAVAASLRPPKRILKWYRNGTYLLNNN